MEKGTHRGLYKSIQKTLKFFQTFALLEVSFSSCYFQCYTVYLFANIFVEQCQSYFANYRPLTDLFNSSADKHLFYVLYN
jgi:hypothetical protein